MHAKTQSRNRQMFLKVISSLKYLLRQGLAVRAHKESEGNLYQLLLLRSEDDPSLSQWLKRKDYVSPEVINELIIALGNTVLRKNLTTK